MGMAAKAIEIPVQLQTGIVTFAKGTVGHTIASYIQSIHLRRIQYGNGFLPVMVLSECILIVLSWSQHFQPPN